MAFADRDNPCCAAFDEGDPCYCEYVEEIDRKNAALEVAMRELDRMWGTYYAANSPKRLRDAAGAAYRVVKAALRATTKRLWRTPELYEACPEPRKPQVEFFREGSVAPTPTEPPLAYCKDPQCQGH